MQPMKMPSLLPNIFIHPFWWMKEDFLASNKTPHVYPAHSITVWLCTWFAASNLQPFLGEVSATHLGLHVVLSGPLSTYAATWKACFESSQRRQCSKSWVEFQIRRSLLLLPFTQLFGGGYYHYYYYKVTLGFKTLDFWFCFVSSPPLTWHFQWNRARCGVEALHWAWR